MHRPRQHERSFILDIRQRRIRRQPDRHLVTPVPDVVAAGRARNHRLTVAVGGAETNRDARHAADRLDDPHDLRRPKSAAKNLEARREIRDADGATFIIDQFGNDDRRVADVIRAGLDLAVEHHIGKTFFLVAGKQTAEYRVAVIARQTPPHDARGRLQQRRSAPVADDRQIKSVIGHDRACPLSARVCSALRTCAGSLKIPVRPGK